jgi:hypothetical protein
VWCLCMVIEEKRLFLNKNAYPQGTDVIES